MLVKLVEKVLFVLESEFVYELLEGCLNFIDVIKDFFVVFVVGDGMCIVKGIVVCFFFAFV